MLWSRRSARGLAPASKSVEHLPTTCGPPYRYNSGILPVADKFRAMHPSRSRLAIVSAMVALFAGLSAAQTTAPVTRLSEFPFDQWTAAPDHSTIKWEIRLLPAELSIHQRLVQRIQAVVPGRELENRRGRGELVVLTRIEDSDGRQWQTGTRLNLVNVQANVKSDELTFTLAAFVKPGDYRVLIALCDTHTMEHSFIRRALHIAPLKPDPLPHAWLGLEPVEFLPSAEPPDSWFLPDVKGLLHLPVDAKQAVRIDLLVNITPSERSSGPMFSLRRNMASVIPALKILSGLNVKLQPPSASVIDLARHRIAFDTSNAATLDWSILGKALMESNPAIIDVKSLAGQHSMREYFADEVARRAGAQGPPRWLIVMSGSLFFSKQEETPLPELPQIGRAHV